MDATAAASDSQSRVGPATSRATESLAQKGISSVSSAVAHVKSADELEKVRRERDELQSACGKLVEKLWHANNRIDLLSGVAREAARTIARADSVTKAELGLDDEMRRAIEASLNDMADGSADPSAASNTTESMDSPLAQSREAAFAWQGFAASAETFHPFWAEALDTFEAESDKEMSFAKV